MKQKELGKTGLFVSEIAFGGVEIGIPYGIGVKTNSDMLTEKEAIALLNAALENGINYFDTARMYGNSEYIIGKTFKEKREQVVIATKCCHFLDKNGEIPEASKLEKCLMESFHKSLEALKTDYIDIYMLHQVNEDIIENETIINFFSKLKEEGKIRATGVSTYTLNETKKAIQQNVWDILQLPFNLMDQRQKSLFNDASKNGVGIVVRSVLLKGLLSNRGKNLHPKLENVEKHIESYNVLLEQTKFNLPTLAIKFALSFPEVSSVLVGIDKTEYLEQALIAGQGRCLTKEELDIAIKLSFPNPEFIDLSYWDKMNWLK